MTSNQALSLKVLLQQAHRSVVLCVLLFFIPNMVSGTSLALDNSCNEKMDAKHSAPIIHCGSSPSAFLTNDKTLWVAFEYQQHVYVSRSFDMGVSYTPATKVNRISEDIEHNGENRPKIVVAESGEVMVSWTLKTSPRFTGEIRFARSIDSSASFNDPITINDDGLMTGHRFDSMHLTASGLLYLTWIDKRDLLLESESGLDYPGAAIYYSVSTDLGASFSVNHRVSHNSCECCRIAMADHEKDGVALVWRQIFNEEIRDHAFATIDPYGLATNLIRATVDDWYINACPHHGPAMAQAIDGENYHLSWFSNGDINKGLYYSKVSPLSGKTEFEVLIDGQPGSGHPSILETSKGLYLVWKTFDGEETHIMLRRSLTGGMSWEDDVVLASTSRQSDYPFLKMHDEEVFLFWQSQEYGYVIQDVTDEK